MLSTRTITANTIKKLGMCMNDTYGKLRKLQNQGNSESSFHAKDFTAVLNYD